MLKGIKGAQGLGVRARVLGFEAFGGPGIWGASVSNVRERPLLLGTSSLPSSPGPPTPEVRGNRLLGSLGYEPAAWSLEALGSGDVIGL